MACQFVNKHLFAKQVVQIDYFLSSFDRFLMETHFVFFFPDYSIFLTLLLTVNRLVDSCKEAIAGLDQAEQYPTIMEPIETAKAAKICVFVTGVLTSTPFSRFRGL